MKIEYYVRMLLISALAAGLSLPAAASACASQGGVWYPDFSKHQAPVGGGILVKF